MKATLTLFLVLLLTACSVNILKYKDIHIAQYVLINKKTIAFQTYNRKPDSINYNNYHLATIKRMKKTKKGIVWIDCITEDKTTIRLILNK